jgi:hypothetical protein
MNKATDGMKVRAGKNGIENEAAHPKNQPHFYFDRRELTHLEA